MKRLYPTPSLNPREQAAREKRQHVYEVVMASGTAGLTPREIAKRCGLAVPYVGATMKVIASLGGEVECTHPTGGTCARWGAVGVRERFKANQDAARELRARAWANRTKVIRAEFERPSIQYTIPAKSAHQLPKRGPASVWELAPCAA